MIFIEIKFKQPLSQIDCGCFFNKEFFILKNKSPTHILGEKSLCERVVVAQPTKSLYKPFSKIGCAEHVDGVILRLYGRLNIVRAMIEEFNRTLKLRFIRNPLIFAVRKSP